MDRERRVDATEERRELKTARARERSCRRGARVALVDALVNREKDEMWTNRTTPSALEVPQGAAVHPASTSDDVTARHGTRSL